MTWTFPRWARRATWSAHPVLAASAQRQAAVNALSSGSRSRCGTQRAGTRNESVTSIGKSSSSCGGMTHLSGRYAKGRATSGTSGEAIAEEGGPGRARGFGFAGGLASWPAMMTPATSPGWPRRRRPLQHALVGRELKAQRRLTSARRKWHRSRRSGRGSGPAIVASALEEPVKRV